MSAAESANTDPATHPRWLTPRSAYIHVPFCHHHCGYCNFSVVAGRLDLVDDYLRAVQLEMTRCGGPYPVDTLYVGGGTPTQLPPRALAGLLDRLRRHFVLSEGGELTLEANPEDLKDEYVDVLRDAGVTRVSLGAQSFFADKLRRLDRQHSVADIDRSIDVIRRVEAELAIDLIFAAPDESPGDWRAELAAVVARAPEHISCYGLTYELGTRFFAQRQRGLLIERDEETQREQYETAIDTLIDHGFEHYEVSNFARPGRRSRHNQAYWLGRTYFGIGPGAARFVAARRSLNHRSTTTYLKRVLQGDDPTSESSELSEVDYAHDRLVFGLRMLDGVDRHQFARETGQTIEQLVGRQLAPHLQRGWFVWNGDRLQLTRSGLLISDAIWPDLV